MIRGWTSIANRPGAPRWETVARAGSVLLLGGAASLLVFVVLVGSASPRHAAMPAWSLDPLNLETADDGLRRLFEVSVTVTGYSSTVAETDETPFITASNTRVRRGIIALSRDLLREYTPGAPFTFGDRVELAGIGDFLVEDTMNRRYTKRADIWFDSTHKAIHWGRQSALLVKHVPDPLERFEEANGSPFEIPDRVDHDLFAAFHPARAD